MPKKLSATRSSRTKTSSPSKPTKPVARSTKTKRQANLKAVSSSDLDGDDVDGNQSPSDDGSDVYEEPEYDVKSLDSDALDDDDDDENESIGRSRSRKRKRVSPVKTSPKKATPRKKKKATVEDTDDADDDFDLKEGQEIVGTVVEAPKTGRGALSSVVNLNLNFINTGIQCPLGRYHKTRSTS